jgi:hypothetical protein
MAKLKNNFIFIKLHSFTEIKEVSQQGGKYKMDKLAFIFDEAASSVRASSPAFSKSLGVCCTF